MTYPHPAVTAFIDAHFLPVRLYLEDRAAHAAFRRHNVLWTPTLTFLDRRGQAHYQSVGYLPPELFVTVLQIGLGRLRLGWARYAEAAEVLEAAGRSACRDLAAEALYWLGMAYYLPTRHRADLMRGWERLQRDHPASIWAQRIAPGQQHEERS